jgi:hypothetical protein
MAVGRKRCWKRWVSVGHYDLTRLVWIARRNGMKCIDAYKFDMHFYNELGLFGTSQQMQATETTWQAPRYENGHICHEVLRRKPPSAFGVNVSIGKKNWLERKLPPVGDMPQGTSWDELRCIIPPLERSEVCTE